MEPQAITTMIPIIQWDMYHINLRGVGPGTMTARPIPPGPVIIRNMYPCKDGYVFLLLGGGAQAGYVTSSSAIVKMANEEGMALEIKDFDWTKFNSRTILQEEIDRITSALAEYLRTKTKAELLKAAVERNILLVPVNTIKDLVESEQYKAREFWVEVEHPELGESLIYPSFPMKWTEFPPYQPQRRAPLIGEHNEEIYITELGLSKEDLVLLRNRGVV